MKLHGFCMPTMCTYMDILYVTHAWYNNALINTAQYTVMCMYTCIDYTFKLVPKLLGIDV